MEVKWERGERQGGWKHNGVLVSDRDGCLPADRDNEDHACKGRADGYAHRQRHGQRRGPIDVGGTRTMIPPSPLRWLSLG